MENSAEKDRYNIARCTLIKAMSQLGILQHRIALFENPKHKLEPLPVPDTETLSDVLRELEKLVAPTVLARKQLDAMPTGTFKEIGHVAHLLGLVFP